jgi:AcrR family transcriptional regulator
MPTPARTSLAEIVAAGRAILEADGLPALTMQRVAAAVGVRGPSLYKRVRDRGTLVRLIAEDGLRELAAALEQSATGGDARVTLRRQVDAFRAFAHAHPATYRLLFAPLPDAWRPAPDLNRRATEPVLRTAAALAGPAEALEAGRTVTAWAHGFVSMELAGGFRLGGDLERAYAYGVERLADALAARRAEVAPSGISVSSTKPSTSV